MRFGVHSPPRRPANSFGLRYVDSDYDEWSDSDSEVHDDSFLFGDDDPEPCLDVSSSSSVTRKATDLLAETLAAVRLQTSYTDPYEEWTRKTRQDSLRVVLHRSEQSRTSIGGLQDAATRIASERYATIRAAQEAEIKAHLARFAAIRRQEEERLTTSFKQRDRQLWENVEAVIKQEENKVRQSWEASERVRQEEARKKAEDEARIKEQAEQARKAEEAAAERTRLQAEAAAKRKEEARKAAELIQQTEKAQAAAVEQRNQVGQTTALDDWTVGRAFLHRIKGETMPSVKLTSQHRVVYNGLRRKMTAKIGQITNDETAIQGIVTFIVNSVQPSQPYEPVLYGALLSGLAKAILLQAETEVSASSKTAVPLARVTALLLDALPNFHEALWARMIQRVGGWAVPILPPPVSDREDDSGRTLTPEEYRKVCGFRSTDETSVAYTARVTGIMTLYFSILVTSSSLSMPMPPNFAFPRYWSYFGRLLSSPGLLKQAVAPQVLTCALEVGGSQANKLWRKQFQKLIRVILRTLSNETSALVIGGPAVEGRQGRTRVQLEAERILAEP